MLNNEQRTTNIEVKILKQMKLLVDSGSTKADWIAIDDNGKVIFRGKETSLSGSALIVTNEMGYDWGQVQGAGYWCYQGKTLRDLVSN